MRFMPIAVALLVAASAGFAEPPKAPPNQKGGIQWEANYEQARARAIGEGKLLFVDILTDG